MKCQLWFNWRGWASRWDTFFYQEYISFHWMVYCLFFFFDIFLGDVGVPRGGRYQTSCKLSPLSNQSRRTLPTSILENTVWSSCYNWMMLYNMQSTELYNMFHCKFNISNSIRLKNTTRCNGRKESLCCIVDGVKMIQKGRRGEQFWQSLSLSLCMENILKSSAALLEVRRGRGSKSESAHLHLSQVYMDGSGTFHTKPGAKFSREKHFEFIELCFWKQWACNGHWIAPS